MSDLELRPITSLASTRSSSTDDDDEEEEEDVQDEERKIIASYGAGQRKKKQGHRRIRVGYIVLSTVTLFTSLVASVWIYRHPHDHILGPRSTPYHSAFDVITSTRLAEYQSQVVLYSHKKTKAEFLAYIPPKSSIVEDKVFGIGFRTKPKDNTGVAHILEHSVLNGSRKYPTKDPFLHLLKGSLHTFLNAMTYNDRTVYPVASRNPKDFANLMSVYLDAVFFPRCIQPGGEWVLKQEGWRYDITEDGSGDLELKGVVYSEMKGVYSDPESLMQRKTESLLYPDNTYQFDSGGDPQFIPMLAHDDFVAFYRSHYHPTNAKIFVSGEIQDINNAMSMVDEYLQQFSANPKVRSSSRIEFQPKRFAHHLYQSIPYPVAQIPSDGGQHMFAITWLLNDRYVDSSVEIAFVVLNQLLIGTTSAPLNKRLLESGFGDKVIGYGLERELLQMSFSVGMKGVKGHNIVALEALILQILQDISETGFEEEDIAAAMNSVEFVVRFCFKHKYVDLLLRHDYARPDNWDAILPSCESLIQGQNLLVL